MEALGKWRGDWEKKVQGMREKRRQQNRERLRAAVQQHGSGILQAVAGEWPLLPWGNVERGLAIDAAVGMVDRYDQATEALQACATCEGEGRSQSPAYPQQGSNKACTKPTLNSEGEVVWEDCEKALRAREQAAADRRLGESLLPKRFQRRKLGGFETPTAEHRQAVQAARGLLEQWGEPECRGLLLMGPAGTGKTHLAAGVMLVLMQRGVAARYYTVPDMLATLREGIDGNRVETLMAGMREVPLLVLDDLGKEYIPRAGGANGGYQTGAWVQQELYRLVNHRYEEDRPVVITTNLSEKELTRRYGPALVSRLAEMCRWVTLDVPDWRRKGGDA